MVYESETMILIEFEVTSQRRATFRPKDNDQLLATNLDLLEETREIVRLRVAGYQQRIVRYYNKNARIRSFNVGDLVLHIILPGARKPSVGP